VAKRTSNDLQNIHTKNNDRVTGTPLKTGGELGCSGRVSSTDTNRSASYLDLHLEIDSERSRTKLYHKRDDFNFLNLNFSFIPVCSNIPSAPAYGVYIKHDDALYISNYYIIEL
jgi:hypothetical protein